MSISSVSAKVRPSIFSSRRQTRSSHARPSASEHDIAEGAEPGRFQAGVPGLRPGRGAGMLRVAARGPCAARAGFRARTPAPDRRGSAACSARRSRADSARIAASRNSPGGTRASSRFSQRSTQALAACQRIGDFLDVGEQIAQRGGVEFEQSVAQPAAVRDDVQRRAGGPPPCRCSSLRWSSKRRTVRDRWDIRR